MVEQAQEMIDGFDDGGGELNQKEFRAILVEMMVNIYYGWFNHSMDNVECARNLEVGKVTYADDRDFKSGTMLRVREVSPSPRPADRDGLPVGNQMVFFFYKSPFGAI